ncbi:hypothetical protein [Emticicia fontis]
MGKPNANVSSMLKINLNNYDYHQQEVLHSLKEPHSKILDLPVIKYYQSTDFSLIKSKKPIDSAGLIEFLGSLGISLKIAKHYFFEVSVYNKKTHEKLKTLGIPNEDEGFELINPFLKGTIGAQTISFIRGTKPNTESIHIFKDSLDFLSFLSKIGGKKIVADAIILHANACIDQIKIYIQNYGYKQLYTWMNNDEVGKEAQDQILTLLSSEKELKIKAMSNLYKPFKTLHNWYQAHDKQ